MLKSNIINTTKPYMEQLNKTYTKNKIFKTLALPMNKILKQGKKLQIKTNWLIFSRFQDKLL